MLERVRCITMSRWENSHNYLLAFILMCHRWYVCQRRKNKKRDVTFSFISLNVCILLSNIDRLPTHGGISSFSILPRILLSGHQHLSLASTCYILCKRLMKKLTCRHNTRRCEMFILYSLAIDIKRLKFSLIL